MVRRFQEGGTTNVPQDPLLGARTGQSSSLSPWAGPYVTEMLGRGAALSELPYQAYEGPLTAGPSNLQQQAFSGVAGLAVPDAVSGAASSVGDIAGQFSSMGYDPIGSGQNAFTAPGNLYTAGDISTGRFDSAAADRYMNPFLEQALEPQFAEARRQADIQRLQDRSRLTQAGAFGGGRQAIMESEASRNLLRNLSDITGRGYASAYDRAQQAFTSDEARGLEAQRLREQSGQAEGVQALRAAESGAQYGLAGQRLAEDSRQFGASYGMDALREAARAREMQSRLGLAEQDAQTSIFDRQLRAGSTQRGIESDAVRAGIGQFEQEENYPREQVQFMQSLLDGLPITTQEFSYQQPSGLNALGGSVGGIMQLYNTLFGGEGNEGGDSGGSNFVQDLVNRDIFQGLFS